MSRKDTILIAVIINAGLLAILLATAIIYDPDKALDQTEMSSALVNAKTPVIESPSLVAVGSAGGDEVDNVLNSYTYRENLADVFINEPVSSTQVMGDEEETSPEMAQSQRTTSNDQFVEVIVKKGDVLEKIAKANGTTVSAIKKANNLQNERLKIGQVLKIPLKKESTIIASTSSAAPQPAKKKEPEVVDTQSQYYVIKQGDNPWKIAKQFNLKFEDIVRLNNLDEDSARNLKAGDRIRIK